MKIFTVTFKLTLYKKDSLLLQKEKKKKKKDTFHSNQYFSREWYKKMIKIDIH